MNSFVGTVGYEGRWTEDGRMVVLGGLQWQPLRWVDVIPVHLLGGTMRLVGEVLHVERVQDGDTARIVASGGVNLPPGTYRCGIAIDINPDEYVFDTTTMRSTTKVARLQSLTVYVGDEHFPAWPDASIVVTDSDEGGRKTDEDRD